ncbi:copper resistance protein CopB [Lysobacteraceae bacterium NML91-0213]|nr:copper resistance protein CopB [Xanthomonadaceae bacterium NML91-0213]
MNMRSRLLALSIGMALSAGAHAQHAHPAQARGAASGCTPEHAAMGHCTMPGDASHDAERHDGHGATSGCTPEHAAMGHCTMPDDASHDAERHDGHGATSGCTPEHAAMGHCTMPSAAPAEPLTPIPPVTDADRAAAFPQLHHHAMEHASPVTTKVYLERLEAWDADHGTGQSWEAKVWIGGDIHRLWLRSEGERMGGSTGSADVEALYGRSVTPWWDLVAGVRQDTRPASRTWGAFGVQGLAPYLFEVSATAYVGSGGQVQVKAEAEYDVRFTNRLVLQPLLEVTASLEDEPEEGIGSGLNKVETGLRLRYELSRRFAPYVGLVHERSFGDTADYARAAGGHARDTRVVAGLRGWW